MLVSNIFDLYLNFLSPQKRVLKTVLNSISRVFTRLAVAWSWDRFKCSEVVSFGFELLEGASPISGLPSTFEQGQARR